MRSFKAWWLGLLLLGAGCTTDPEPCGPSNCPGCCAGDVCQSGGADDACGAAGAACVACTGITTCNSGHVCGTVTCTRLTCAELGDTCGDRSDGCGGNLHCGGCPADQSCNYYGQTRACGKLCTDPCFGTLVCTPKGKCEGPLTGLVLNELPISVAGRLRINGVDVVKGSTQCNASQNPDDAVAVITYRDPAQGISGSETIPCRAANLSFTLALARGTYTFGVRPGVAAARAGLQLPDGEWTAPGAPVEVKTPVADSASRPWFDVRGHAAVGGQFRIDGVAPPLNAFCLDPSNATAEVAVVDFIHRTTGATAQAFVTCTTANQAFRAVLAPGRYDLRVHPGQSAAQAGWLLPATGVLLIENADLATIGSNTTYDVRTVTIAGKLQVNGTAPASNAYCGQPGHANEDVAWVRFVERSKGYDVGAVVKCSDVATFGFSARLPERGTWDVLVAPGLSATAAGLNLLPMEVQVATQLPLFASLTGLNLNQAGVAVTGTVKLRGVAPAKDATFCAASPNADLAILRFRDAARVQQTEVVFRCSSPNWAFALELPAGAWVATLERSSQVAEVSSNVPEGRYTFPFTISVAGPTSVTLDADGQDLGIQLRVDGKIPEVPVLCQSAPGTQFAAIELSQESTGFTATRILGCKNTSWKVTAPLAPGPWKVRVLAANPAAPLGGLLPGWVGLPAAFTVPVASGNVQVDERPVTIKGSVQVSGAAPAQAGNASLHNCGFSGASAFARISNASGSYSGTVRFECVQGADDANWEFTTQVQAGDTYSFALEPSQGQPAFNLIPTLVPVQSSVVVP